MFPLGCHLFTEFLGNAWYIDTNREHLTYAMSINTYSSQKLENLQLDHKEK
ncbi:transposase [Microcystis panniformis FACHB-1757]|uniref:Transposase n=1 Tax=Microcystis panniformis FACHB-1757 TaxID=1638788 RepID=A0A0K1S283_9CHRO|nr:transposase [Microcystis panniformis FACHB-1757]